MSTESLIRYCKATDVRPRTRSTALRHAQQRIWQTSSTRVASHKSFTQKVTGSSTRGHIYTII